MLEEACSGGLVVVVAVGLEGLGWKNFCLGGLGLWIFVGEVVGVLFLFVFVVGVVLVGPQGFSGWCFRTLDQQVSQLVYELRLFW